MQSKCELGWGKRSKGTRETGKANTGVYIPFPCGFNLKFPDNAVQGSLKNSRASEVRFIVEGKQRHYDGSYVY